MTEEEVRQIIRDELEYFIQYNRFLFNKKIQIADNRNIEFGKNVGTKIGTDTDQKIAFLGNTPIVQPTTSVSSAEFSVEAGTAVNAGSTFAGYTIGQIVTALRNLGLIA